MHHYVLQHTIQCSYFSVLLKKHFSSQYLVKFHEESKSNLDINIFYRKIQSKYLPLEIMVYFLTLDRFPRAKYRPSKYLRVPLFHGENRKLSAYAVIKQFEAWKI